MDLESIYDQQTVELMRRTLARHDSFVDVGCHEGRFMEEALAIAPRGRHFGFEPLPDYASKLRKRYAGHPKVTICEAALSDVEGQAKFVYNRDIPSHSGLRERTYPLPDARRETITVRTLRLDDVIGHLAVAMLKIDVEGAELLVMRGATRTIAEHKPVIVFEFGLGAADHYGHGPRDVFAFLADHGMGVFTLDAMLANQAPLTLPEFETQYFTPKNYYFGARSHTPRQATPWGVGRASLRGRAAALIKLVASRTFLRRVAPSR